MGRKRKDANSRKVVVVMLLYLEVFQNIAFLFLYALGRAEGHKPKLSVCEKGVLISFVIHRPVVNNLFLGIHVKSKTVLGHVHLVGRMTIC